MDVMWRLGGYHKERPTPAALPKEEALAINEGKYRGDLTVHVSRGDLLVEVRGHVPWHTVFTLILHQEPGALEGMRKAVNQQSTEL